MIAGSMFAALLLLAPAAGPPDLAGTWKLDASRSRVAPDAPIAGLIAAGAPEVLHISQPASGALVIESQINESHARIYTPGASSSTPVYVGGIGKVTMTSRWEGERLVSEGRRESASGDSKVVSDTREVFFLDPDGTLRVQVTVSGPEGTTTSEMSYTRIRDVGLCDSWPTPCKKPGPRR